MYRFIWIFCLSLSSFSQSVTKRADSLIQSKLYKKAQIELLSYIENHPNDNRAIELLGDSYSYLNGWDQAIKRYKALVLRQPDVANFQYKYGGALAMKAQRVSKLKALTLIGDMKRAFLKAAELDKAHIEARWALVDMYVSLPGILGGSYSKALNYANELEELSKVDGYLAKGYVYEYDDEPELAEKYYKLAVKVGGSVTCYDKLSGFYENQKKPNKAIKTLEEATDKHQRNAIHYQIGKVSADYNIQLEKGEKCLKTYLNNYSSKDGVPEEWAYYRLAQIYKHKGDKAKALEYIDRSLSIRSNFKQARKERALILKK